MIPPRWQAALSADNSDAWPESQLLVNCVAFCHHRHHGLLNILELRTLQVQQRRILNINVLPILLLRPYHYRNLSLTSHWSLEAKDVE